MSTPWWKSGSVEWDENGDRADDAVVYFYQAGTSTPLTVYQDAGESTPHEHPVKADSGRWPAVHIPYGTYKLIIKDAVGGTTLFSDNNIENPAPNDEEVTVDENALYKTGECFFKFKDGTRDGAVRCNARTIGNAASVATERANADCEALFIELYNEVSAPSANVICPVSGGLGANAAVAFAAGKTLTLPDLRGSVPGGLDTMGNTFKGSFNAAIPFDWGGSTVPGSAAGTNVHALTIAQLAAHTHSFSATTGAGSSHTHAVSGNTANESAHTHGGTTLTQNAVHTHPYVTAINKVSTAASPVGIGGNFWAGADTAVNTSQENETHDHHFTTNAGSAHLHAISFTSGAEAAHTHSVSGTSGSNGSGDNHNNMQRTVLGTWYIKL